MEKVFRKFTTTQDLTAAALAFTTATATGGPLTRNCRIAAVYIHFSAGVAPTITTTRISGVEGTNYNVPFDMITLPAGSTDYVLMFPEGEGILLAGDQVLLVITPVIATCYVTLIIEDQ